MTSTGRPRMDGNDGHRPNRQPPHRKTISEWVNPWRHHTYLPIKSSMHAGPSQNRNLLERVGKTARVAGHTSPRRATSSGLRPQDWIYSRVPTQRVLRGMTFDVMKAKGRWVGDSFLLHLRKHAVIIASYIRAVSTASVHEGFVDAPSALRHARRPAQSHIEGE